MKRQEISNIGRSKLITQTLDYMDGLAKKYPVFAFQHFRIYEGEDRHDTGSFKGISFKPHNLWGKGLTIEVSLEDKAGRYREASFELGKTNIKLLISFLQRHLDLLEEYQLDQVTEETNGFYENSTPIQK